ncbi:MAG: ATPase [Chloroflexi bacterium]|nr:ATPase [Chloroflexota bacterium]
MRRVLAVDGGQSTIRVLSPGATEPVEVPGVGHLEGDSVVGVVTAIETAWRRAGAPTVDRAMLGLTTAPTTDADRDRLCGTVGTATGASDVWLADDSVTAHAGALSLGWGVSVTVGTGVACLVAPRGGDQPRILGGHGVLLGDEGGATWIGREAIRAALRAWDGRGPATALGPAVMARFGPLDGLADRIHRGERAVDTIARFAPEVLTIADSGDAVADAIVDAAVEELTLLIAAAVAAAVDVDPAGVPVALGGRLMTPGAPLRLRLDRALATRLPATPVRSADASPLMGARLLGGSDDPGRYTPLVYRWSSAA